MTRSLSFTDFELLATELSLAAVDPVHWAVFLTHLSRACGDIGTHMFGQDPSTGRVLGVHGAGYDPDFAQSFEAYYGRLNPFLPKFAGHAPGRILSSDEMVPRAELVRTEFWADWMRPQDDFSVSGGMMLERSQSAAWVIGSHVRYRDQDKLEPLWQDGLRRLQPLILNALATNRALAGNALEIALLREGLDPGTAAVFVLADGGHVVGANPMARSMIEKGDPVRADVMGRLAGLPIGWDRRMLRPHDWQGYQRSFLRLTPQAAERIRYPAWSTRTPAFVMVLETRGAEQGLAGLAAEVGLTHAEREVAVLLAQGLSLPEIAERRGSTIHTVRNQVKSGMSKAQVSRQSEYVALLLRSLRRF